MLGTRLPRYNDQKYRSRFLFIAPLPNPRGQTTVSLLSSRFKRNRGLSNYALTARHFFSINSLGEIKSTPVALVYSSVKVTLGRIFRVKLESAGRIKSYSDPDFLSNT